jgi:23S rRNA (uracil1939-C5)-methyltransferase
MTLSQAVNVNCQYFPQCGGCDFLDLDEEKYRAVKKEILENLIKNDIAINPEWIWVGANSRRKIIFQVSHKNQLGFFAKKTNEIVEIDDCFIADTKIKNLIPILKNFLKTFEQAIFTQISTTLFDNGLDLIFSSKKELNFSQMQKITAFAKEHNLNISSKVQNQTAPIYLNKKNQIFYPNFKINLDSEIFIQATKSGLESIIKICRSAVGSSKKIIDIYAGFGTYSFALSDLVTSIYAVEGDEKMVGLINKNAIANDLQNKIKAEVCDLYLTPIRLKDLSKFDLAIMNPPRKGAAPQALEISKSSLKKLVYVSCNPQTFLRDAKILIDSKFQITKLYALDQFYSTRHLELVAIFERG